MKKSNVFIEPHSSVIVIQDRLDSSTTRSSFRIEVKTRQQFHFTTSSHHRTRCLYPTLPDNSCRKDSTHHSRLHQKPSGQPRTASFHKRYQTTFNAKYFHPRCTRQLQIRLVARRPSKPTFGSTLHWTSRTHQNQQRIIYSNNQENNDHIIVSIQRLKPCTRSFDRQKKKHHHLQSSTVPTEVYCYCQQPYNREMIKCCNNNCKIAWYHYDCVSLIKHPLTTWFCPSSRTSTT